MTYTSPEYTEDTYCEYCDGYHPIAIRCPDVEAIETYADSLVRTFDTGANRDVDTGKSNFVGCLDPAVLSAFARYMESCSHLPDGTVRDAGNWKKGMPTKSYMESLMRHVVDIWLLYEGEEVTRPETGKKVTLEDALGGAMFNIQGLWRNHLRG